MALNEAQAHEVVFESEWRLTGRFAQEARVLGYTLFKDIVSYIEEHLRNFEALMN